MHKPFIKKDYETKMKEREALKALRRRVADKKHERFEEKRKQAEKTKAK